MYICILLVIITLMTFLPSRHQLEPCFPSAPTPAGREDSVPGVGEMC